jgi:multiple sugar transport system permease protein
MHKPKKAPYVRAEARAGILFSMPIMLGFLIFVLGPMIASLALSFTDYRITGDTSFIGIEHYRYMFSGEDLFFVKSLSVTSYYVFLSVPACIIFSFFIALLMNQQIKGKSIFRTIFYLPTIVPVVASSLVWMWLLNPDLGLVNNLLRSWGLPTSKWMFGERSAVPSLVLMSLWGTGSQMVIFLAGLQGIPRHLYEALDVDGGNALHKFRYITLPMMTPTIFFNLVIALIGGFQIFTQALIMTSGGPNNATLFYVYHMFRLAFQQSRMSLASAWAWVLFIIIAFLTFIAFKFSSHWVYYEDGSR